MSSAGSRNGAAGGPGGGRTGRVGAESARYWQHPELPGLDLLRARYIRKNFVPHTHDTFVLAAITAGVEEFRHGGDTLRVGPGGLALLNPDVPHTGHAGVPEGWAYQVLYPAPELIQDIAAQTLALRGSAAFQEVIIEDDPRSHRLLTEVHRAAEVGNALAADSLLRIALAGLLRRYGAPAAPRSVSSAGARTALRARELLEERMADPPSLDRLAAELGTGPFALLRAFREIHGMPPHTWLTNARVRRARLLLDAGSAPAEVAVAVGFTDQPHLNRHFTRIVGVPPGAYRRGRAPGRTVTTNQAPGVEPRPGARTYKTAGGRAP
ncbi:AraC family transcriptional regulator [Streptomyces palmae]|uniref:AraC family transcriptional regulator n=1 Tax=Streptomyces palmae TaxID=1701085 RepID=A0A4Z0HEY2_9ACTN|nr:AraC family transcriptional regulator [Streptomyces palmae]TGB13043.1 AraC family transcriptional regulator [Streptomyces palmae]